MRTVTFLIAALLQTAPTAPAVRVGDVAGEVQLVRQGGTAFVRVGDTISAGDRLHSPKGSSLTLSAESGVVLQLGAATSLEMKNVDGGEIIALLTEGRLNVRSAGKPVRIETKHGQVIADEDSQEFDLSYSGDVVQVLLIRGSIRAEVLDPSKVVFKSAADLGTRTYEAGSLSPTAPRTPGETVIVYPQVNDPTRTRGPRLPTRTPVLPPK